MGVLNNIQRFNTFDIREYIKNFQRQIQTGFKLDANNNYDIQQKRLANVGEGVDGGDSVTKHQMEVGLSTKSDSTSVLLLDGRNHMTGDLDLRGNKIILPGEIDMDRKLITNLLSDPNQDLSAVNMVTLKTNIGSKADKNYVDGEIAKQNDKFVKKTGDVLSGDLILVHDSYPVQGNTNKAVSYETQREIFLSRKESFPMETDLDMNNNFIQNVATPTSSHQGSNKGYCDFFFLNRQKGGRLMGSLSMNQNDLFELPAPKFGSSAVNKDYVDAKIPMNPTQFVKNVGDRMGGDLDMDAYFIKNVGINLSDDSTAVPRSYVDSYGNSAIHNPLTNDLYMSNFQIKNLKTPINPYDAVNKKYFDEELLKSHLISAHIENAFKYLSDQDESSSESNIIVNGIVDFNGSPHKNKKAYDIDLAYTAGTQNYNSKIGINLYPLPIGKYTVIMEYFFPEDRNISFVAGSSTAVINKQVTTSFTDHKKLLVQFNQQSKDTPDYLFFNIRGSATTSTNPEGYLVFYGVKGWMESVPPEIYDRALETGMFEYDGGKMKMNMDLDLNGFSLINAREDYFHLKGYYKSSVNNRNILFGNNVSSTKVPFGGYLIEVYVLISSAAAGNDYAFRLIIRGHEHYTSNADITSTSNSKFYRLMDFNKNHFLPSGRGFMATIAHDSHAATPPKFTEAKFYFKFFRDDNFS